MTTIAKILSLQFCIPRLIVPQTFVKFSSNSLSTPNFVLSKKIHLKYFKMNAQKNGRISGYETVQVESNGIIADEIVDLRSDTVTKPSKAMRQAMAEAEVGDDVFEEDLTVKELESRVANLLGKQAGLFVASGTMGNLLAVLVHCDERGSEMIVGDQSHIFYYEQGSSAQFGGVHSNQIPTNPNGTFDIRGVIDRIRPNDFHHPKTKLIGVENTHNRCGGRIIPLDWLDELGKVGKEFKVPLHMDGARVFNAAIGLKQPVSRIVRDFDSISICFSKGLGAPVGSVLVGDEDFIKKARRLRKALGGGMRQSGVLAAAAIYSLDHIVPRLKDDHENAKIMANIINQMNSPNVFVKVEDLETNIIILNVTGGIDVKEFCTRIAVVEPLEKDAIGSLTSIKCLPWSETKVRLVTHLDISEEMAIKAAKKICFVTKELTQKNK